MDDEQIGKEACNRAMHIQKGATLNIFDDIKVDLKQIWYQDMQQIHGSIQLKVFCGNNNKVWVPRMTNGSSRATALSTDRGSVGQSVTFGQQ